MVKFYPGEEKRFQIKKGFEEANREAMKDFDYAPDKWEALLEKAYEGVSLHYVFLIDCKGADIEVAGTSIRMTIKKGSPQEKIYKYVCKAL